MKRESGWAVINVNEIHAREDVKTEVGRQSSDIFPDSHKTELFEAPVAENIF